MFEAIIWDDRDAESPEPSSSLGIHFTREEAEEAIRKYLEAFPQHAQHVVKTEIVSA